MIGIDGTGKTTHAKALVKALREHGIAAHYVWCRGRPEVFLPLIQLFKQLVFRQSVTKSVSADGELPESDPLRQRLLSIPWVARLWRTILVVDTLVQVLIGVRIPLRLGRVVVCDRYIFDQMVDVAVDLHFSKSQFQEWANNSAYRIFPRPDLTLFFDIAEEVSHSRKDDSLSIPEIALRRNLYLSLTQIAPMLGPMIAINASENLEDVDRKIRSAVLKLLGQQGDWS